jgi:hypothetical protein
MSPAADRVPAGRCDADATCLHAPCFQVQLDASRPRQAHRQANACAYHVTDVIEALRAWAAERDLAGGQLTILAIEPAAGGRVPGRAGQARGAGQPELRGFAFSTIPLGSVQRLDPGHDRLTSGDGTARTRAGGRSARTRPETSDIEER